MKARLVFDYLKYDQQLYGLGCRSRLEQICPVEPMTQLSLVDRRRL